MPNLFEEQLRTRIKADEDIFSNALNDISEKISGKLTFEDIREDEIANAKSALEEIAKFYGIPEDVLKRAESQGSKTLDEQMNFIFGSVGIMYRDVELTEGWYNDASGVYLGTTKSGQYIALMPGYRGYSYKDHTTGKGVRLNSKVMQGLSSNGLCFYKPMPARKLGVHDLLMHAVKSLSLSDLTYIGVITLLITLVSMVTPYLTKIIYSQLIYSKNLSALNALFIFMVAATISITLLQIARSLVLSRIEVKINTAVNASVIMRLINLPAAFFKKFSSGELAQRASSATALCSSIVNIIFSTGLTAVMSLIYLQQIFLFTPVLVMPALWIMVALFTSSMLLIWGHSRLFKRKMFLKSKEYGLIYTLITGIQKIKLSGAERRAFAKWGSIYKDSAALEYDPPLYLKLTPVFQPAITLIGTFVLYFRAYNAGVNAEDYMAFMASYSLMSGAFVVFCNLTLISASITPLINLIKPILEAEPEILHGRVVSKVKGGIELNNVSFRYDEKLPLILNKISLKIRPGEYVAITGKFGCGKSTLMRLLLGFEEPMSGVIYYDGNNIKTLDLRTLRSHIGCVIQNSMLFPGSIYSNIVISAPDLTEDDAWKAAEMAGIAEDISKMPMKMHTMISEGSGTLSGGQRQRIIIARAIAPKPKILLFDEATSALDNLTQKIVSDSLEKLKCTRIVIAHRLSTVRHCDRILVLDNGHIAEEGSYDELISRKGLFASLVERQQLGEAV